MTESPADIVTSASWDGATPSIAVLVSTFRRSAFLPELVACLEAQSIDRDRFEVVLVDNGSGDETWATIEDIAARTPLRLLGLRVAENHGPAPGRNAGARHVRAPIFAITDDDCLPTPTWVERVEAAFADQAVEVVQGRVEPDPVHAEERGPWDHTVYVMSPSPFFETCNVSYRRSAFERVGGFDESDPLLHPPTGRAFGEDAVLAWAVQETGGRAGWADDAVVHHRWIKSTYARWLADQRQLERFPGLAQRSPLVARWRYRGAFLHRQSAAFDLGLAGLALGLTTRRWLPLALWMPWLRLRWPEARHRVRGDREAAAVVLAQLAWSDAVALASMLKGTVRYRKVFL